MQKSPPKKKKKNKVHYRQLHDYWYYLYVACIILIITFFRNRPTLKYYIWNWVILFANSAIFQQYHGENKLIFNEMMMRSALY